MIVLYFLGQNSYAALTFEKLDDIPTNTSRCVYWSSSIMHAVRQNPKCPRRVSLPPP